ncbi:hypothetical protein DUNSADRAFT_12765 [Dunaliella salina]|uniref:Coiled-coil domain-containing protein 130 n=1 Tax=Dunaliella salina TaxID=3046 RepID=A0ABQ7GAN9_DUNSA|nr:hypothetical protein DUNSADRAFT_12765 [Dunaliella salina]|eukprot:KAF5831661.1 hypothetical protein DUNSADRAFT_12765 [Dunaliella salina]
MSSLAAVQADGFYHPPDFNPDVHKSLNKFHNSHPLRERASKLDQGILVIRFEVPYHIWCSKCHEKIAQGVRFNAEKKCIGQYHSTKIWQFAMRHHCGCIITIQTDPKRTEYIVVEGAKKKVEGIQTAAEAEVIELEDDEEKKKRATDPLYRLERGEESKKRALSTAQEIALLQDDSDAKHADPYAANRILRAKLRAVKSGDRALEKRRKQLGLGPDVELLPDAEEDAQGAALAFFAHGRSDEAAKKQHEAQRESILKQSIFSSPHRIDSKHNSSSAAAGGRGSNSSSSGSRSGQLLAGRGGSGQRGGSGIGGGSSLQQRAAKLARLQGRV